MKRYVVTVYGCFRTVVAANGPEEAEETAMENMLDYTYGEDFIEDSLECEEDDEE